jgi:hypothetical protein
MVAVMGFVLAWPSDNIVDKMAAIPVGSSKKEVLSQLGEPMLRFPIHGPDHEYYFEQWIYPGPLKLAPEIAFSPLRFSFFNRSWGPKVHFDPSGRVETITLPKRTTK